MVGSGPFPLPPGGWTHDTAMALGMSDSLVVVERFTGADIMQRWPRWMEEGARNTAKAGSDGRHLSRDAKAAGGCVSPATDAPPSPAQSR